MDERINPGYAAGQLARALRTARDETVSRDTRQLAADRVRSWASVLRGMADGTVRPGSRTPVADLPAWVTPQVVRGGFVTGQALAAEPWGDDETARARALGLPESRAALLASWLTDDGLAELTDLLDAGTYRVVLPEDAALLVVAWLARGGAVDTACALLDTVAPLADRLRFMPRVAPARPGPGDVVARRTAAQAREALAQVRPNRAVETQREVLSLWLPLTDDFLALWWDTRDEVELQSGRVMLVVGRRWTDEHTQIAHDLLARYDAALAASSCRKYRDPAENLPILVAATQVQLDDRLGTARRRWQDLVTEGSQDEDERHELSRGQARRGSQRVVEGARGLWPSTRAHRPVDDWGLGHWVSATRAVMAMVAKRGEPASERLASLRRVQATVAQAPGRADLAQVARDRLACLAADQGIDDVAALLGPVTSVESDRAQARDDRFDVPAGTPMPPVVVRNVRLATAAPVEDLVAQGVVPSAEVLAELVPDLTAQQVGAAYDDPALGRLMAQTYQAFRRRRSLLLLDLAHQVRFDELPWVAAVADHATGRPDDPAAVGRRLAALAIDAFPATILPNPLISELSTLLDGLDLPLTEELAADIFMGEFSAKFPRAARQAATWSSGSLYQRYYDLPWDEVLAHDDQARPSTPVGRRSRPDRLWFAALCTRDVDGGLPWSVARNGMIVERQQQLTTHNLAVLLGPGGVVPTRPWADLAAEALAATVHLLVLAQSQDRPLATVKDAAYALRQALVFLSRTDPPSVTAVLDGTATRKGADRWPVTAVLDGVRHVASGGSFAADGTCPGGGRRLVGWTVGRHWAVRSRTR